MSYTDPRKSDGPHGLAYRMSEYIKDPQYIADMVGREYGESRALPVSRIEKMIAQRRAEKERARRTADRRVPIDSDAIDYAPKLLSKPKATRTYTDCNGRLTKRNIVTVEACRSFKAPDELPREAKLLIHSVAWALGLKYNDVIGPGQRKPLVVARSIAAKLLRERNPAVYSYPKIVRLFNRRDHTTARYYVKQFDVFKTQYPDTLKVYRSLGGAE